MGLKDFFGKTWKGLKTGASWIGDKVKKGVGFVGRLAKPVLNITRMIPGVIGTASNVANGIIDGVSTIANSLPNSKVKNKIGEITGEMKTEANNVIDKANDIAGKVGNVVETTAPLIEKGNNWLNKTNFTPQVQDARYRARIQQNPQHSILTQEHVARFKPVF